MMLRIVIDTNLYLSAILFSGVPAKLILKATEENCRIFISPQIISEIERKLRGKFRRDPAEVHWQTQKILAFANLVNPTEAIDACRDPDDNRILECAVAGHADYIITGDRDLLVLGSFREIPILTARQFLDHLSTPPDALK